MDHWFDHLTKRLVTTTPSRGTVLAGAGAAMLAAATNARWFDAFAAVRPGRVAPKPIVAKTAKLGPCTVYSKGAVYQHQLVSSATAGGHAAVLHKTRSVDPKIGTTLDTTVLVDGKQQVKLTGVYRNGSRSEKLILGDAFGFGGAVLTTSDEGATLRGTVGGKTIQPYAVGSGKKLRFVGAPPAKTQASGITDAIKAVFAKANSDQAQCTSSAHAFQQRGGALALEPYRARHDAHRELTQETSCGTSAPNQLVYGTTLTCAQYTALINQSNKLGGGQSVATTETWFTGLCEACNNKCNGNLFDEVANLVECAGSLAEYCANGCDKCKKFVNYSGVQFNCQQGCTAKGAACNPVPCPEGATSCNKDQVCVYGGNYAAQFGAPGAIGGICCPKSRPHACGQPGNFIYGGYSACCGALAPCTYDTRFGPMSSASNTNYAGFLCCPENHICGKLVKGVFVGQCCLPDQTCCDSTVCCPQGQKCAVQAAVHLPQQHAPDHVSTPGGAKVCCPPNQVRGGQCCQSAHWCGDQCCANGSVYGCPGGKCPTPTLCLTGVRCGFVCCETGCADAKTSTCKKSKCGKGHYECQPNQSNATSVCCPTGATCANGKCCRRGTTACGHKTNGAFGCWPHAQCATPPPIK